MLTPEEKQEILLKLFYDFKEKDNINNLELNDITKLLDLAEKTWNLSVSPRGSEIIFQKYYI